VYKAFKTLSALQEIVLMQIVLLLDLAGEKAGWISMAENYLNDVPYRIKKYEPNADMYNENIYFKKVF
jgi:hypothetical protein